MSALNVPAWMGNASADIVCGFALFTLGAHVDLARTPCEHCQTVHDLLGVSLGFVFLRVLIVVRFGCTDPREAA